MSDEKFSFTFSDGVDEETIIYSNENEVDVPFGSTVYFDKNAAIAVVLEKLSEIMKEGE